MELELKYSHPESLRALSLPPLLMHRYFKTLHSDLHATLHIFKSLNMSLEHTFVMELCFAVIPYFSPVGVPAIVRGDVVQELIFVLTGEVKMFRPNQGVQCTRLTGSCERVLVGEVTRGHHFGDMEICGRVLSLVDYIPYGLNTLVAVKLSELYRIFERFPSHAKAVAHEAHKKRVALSQVLQSEVIQMGRNHVFA